MKPRNMIAIVSVAAAAVAVAFVAISRQSGDAAFEPGGAFAPAIAERQADVDRIVVERGAAKVELAREGAGWTLASRAGYPARFEEVKALVSGLAGLRTERKMTARPDRHPELGLAWPDASGAAARVALSAGGEPVLEIVLGQERANPRSQFVRRLSEDQTWRVLGSVIADVETRRWIDAELLSLPEGEVRGVRVAGLELRAGEGAGGPAAFEAEVSAAPLAPEAAVDWNDERIAVARRTLPGWLARLELDDVRRAQGAAPDPRISPVFDMVRGTLEVRAVRDGDDVWISFAATPKEGAPGAEEINAKRKYPGDPFVPDWREFAARHEGWEYRLPAWKRSSLEEALKSATEPEGDPTAPTVIPSPRGEIGGSADAPSGG